MNMVYIVLWVLILLGRSAGGKSNSWVPDVHYWRCISYQTFSTMTSSFLSKLSADTGTVFSQTSTNTNSYILQLHSAVRKSKSLTLTDLSQYLDINSSALRKHISHIKTKSTKLRGETKSTFLEEELKITQGKSTSSKETESSTLKSVESKSRKEGLILLLKQGKWIIEEKNVEIQDIKTEKKKLKRKTTSLTNVIEKKRKKFNI